MQAKINDFLAVLNHERTLMLICFKVLALKKKQSRYTQRYTVLRYFPYNLTMTSSYKVFDNRGIYILSRSPIQNQIKSEFVQ